MINIFKIILLIIIKKKINQNSRGKYFLSLLTTLQQPEELLSACIHDNQYDQSDLGHQSWSSWSPTFSDSHVTMAIFPIYPSLSIMMCQYLSYVTCHGWSWFKHGPKSVHFTFMLGFKVLVTFACFDCNFFLESPHVDKHEIINVQMRPLIKCLGGNSLQADRSTLGGTKKATRYTYLSQWQDQPGGAALCSYCCNWRFASSSFNRKYSVDNPPDCQSCCLV